MQYIVFWNSVHFIFIYIAFVMIKIVSRCSCMRLMTRLMLSDLHLCQTECLSWSVLHVIAMLWNTCRIFWCRAHKLAFCPRDLADQEVENTSDGFASFEVTPHVCVIWCRGWCRGWCSIYIQGLIPTLEISMRSFNILISLCPFLPGRLS